MFIFIYIYIYLYLYSYIFPVIHIFFSCLLFLFVWGCSGTRWATVFSPIDNICTSWIFVYLHKLNNVLIFYYLKGWYNSWLLYTQNTILSLITLVLPPLYICFFPREIEEKENKFNSRFIMMKNSLFYNYYSKIPKEFVPCLIIYYAIPEDGQAHIY